MDTILKNLSGTKNIPLEVKELFEKNIVQRQISKGTVLQRSGETIERGFFVKKGLLRSYFIDSKGKEHIFMFAPEGWFVMDFGLLSSDSETTLFIDALEDSSIGIIGKKIFDQADKLPVKLLINDIDKLVKRINTLQKRILLLMGATAEERYIHFTETYPEIIHRVSQKMVASYLGMTPETLSSIRGKLAK